MKNFYPIVSKIMKPVVRIVWAIKHRRANHKTALDYYQTKSLAKLALDSIPVGMGSWTKGEQFCQGCGIGCRNEYEIVKVRVSEVQI